MAVISLSLLPPPSTTHSCFCASGIHFRSHTTTNNFLSIHSPSPFPSTFSNSNSKFSARRKRFHTVFAASSDYYATLGVPKSATVKDIKAAYRRLARQVSNFRFLKFYFILLMKLFFIMFLYCKNL